LGYGFPMESFVEGMKRAPHVIAVDAGSSDPGPYYLGAGKSFTDRNSVKRDLEIMIPAAIEAGIPVIVGTAGGSGATPHLDWAVDIVKEIAREKKLSFKMAIIGSELDKELVKEKLRKGQVTPLHPAKEIAEKDVDEAVHIVAQIGAHLQRHNLLHGRPRHRRVVARRQLFLQVFGVFQRQAAAFGELEAFRYARFGLLKGFGALGAGFGRADKPCFAVHIDGGGIEFFAEHVAR